MNSLEIDLQRHKIQVSLRLYASHERISLLELMREARETVTEEVLPQIERGLTEGKVALGGEYTYWKSYPLWWTDTPDWWKSPFCLGHYLFHT